MTRGTRAHGTGTRGTGDIPQSGGTRGSAIRISGGRRIFLTIRTGTIIITMGLTLSGTGVRTGISDTGLHQAQA